jgi:hypothetical protein
MKLYVKKIWSTTPNEYEYITLERALKRYQRYALSVAQARERGFDPYPKEFDDWLRTEI